MTVLLLAATMLPFAAPRSAPLSAMRPQGEWGAAFDAGANASLTYLFPATNVSLLSGATPFATGILASVGLGGLQLIAGDASADPLDYQNQTYLPDGTYVNGPVLRFASGDTWASFRYSPGGRFLGFTISGPALLVSSPGFSEKITTTRELIHTLGIPLTGNESWMTADEPSLIMQPAPTWRNETVVRVTSVVSGVVLNPANSVVVRYANYSASYALRIEVTAWFDAAWASMTPVDSLRLKASEYLAAWADAKDWTVSDLHARGLAPVPDTGSIDLVLGASLSQPNRVGIATVWIDAWSGAVVRAWMVDITPIVDRFPPTPAWSPWLVVGVIASAALVASVLVARRKEAVGFVLILLLAEAQRVAKEERVDNFIRGQLFGYIVANPGTTYSQLSAALHLANGVLAYHLRVLEKEGFLRSRNVGPRKCFYPYDAAVPELEPAVLSPTQKAIVGFVKDRPGVTQRDIGRGLDFPRRTISYNVRRLTLQGFLRVEGRGKRKRCAVATGSERSSESRLV